MTKGKRCIILSQGPVPLPEHTKVEGGGLRCWGLAKGILSNKLGIGVTVAYHESYKKEPFTKEYQGVDIVTWNIDTLADLIADYDTIIVSYCMSDLSVKTVDSIRPDQQLILDCYVPIYIEVSARNAADIDSEYYNFNNDVGRWAHVLRRGDLFLCASEAQRGYYKGVISALGRINPVTYQDESILVVPYGIYRDKPVAKDKPITKMLKNKKSKKILWFGGIYPWFDLNVLIDAIVELNKDLDAVLTIVGAKNPFNQNPDFLRKYEELVDYINSSGASKYIQLEDWVRFEDRADWYLDSDIVMVVNQEGPENELAWRTRLVDYAWANLPIITNGGDPFGEILLAANAAARLTGTTKGAIASDLLQLLSDPGRLENIKDNLAGVREGLYWDVVTQTLAEDIVEHSRPADFERYGFYESVQPTASARSRLGRLTTKARKIPAYVRKHGLRTTYSAISTVASRKIKGHLPQHIQGKPHIVIVSHQLDMSGGPFVIMDFAKELRKLYPQLPVEFYTFNPVHSSNIAMLNKSGIRPKILIDRSAVIDFRKGDVVVLNTSAHSDQLKEVILSGLESGYLSKLLWYVHEDGAEYIFNPQETRRISRLMQSGKIEMITPAVKTHDSYVKHFGDEHVKIQYYKLVTPAKYHRTLQAKDFKDKLSFLLPGTMNDGRKGQLPLFYAFAVFYQDYYKKNPGIYRDFELVFVGMDKDFMSRQILNHAEKALGDHFRSYGRVTKEEHLDIVLKSNITVCYSMREALPLFVFEGMTAGHPILRNDCSGAKEQLVDGKNGRLLDSNNFQQVIETIEKTLNRNKTSDEDLAKMSKVSYGIAKSQEDNSYKPMAESAKKALHE